MSEQAATIIGTDNALQVLTIGLGGEVFALPASIVREILDPCPTTPVPTSKPFVSQLISLRGRVLPLADLRLRFGMPVVPNTIDTRIVVLQFDIDNEETTVGVLADKVYEVTELDSVVADEVPPVGLRCNPIFVSAIGRRNDQFVMILDMDKVFGITETVRDQNV